MTAKIHYFNPGHETAVLLGSENYTPPRNVQRMIRELSLLPVWYAEPEDFIFTEETCSSSFFTALPEKLRPFATVLSRKELPLKAKTMPETEAAPWGLSPQSLRLFNELKETYQLNLSVPQWKEAYVGLTGRQTAAQCLEKIRELLPDMSIPAVPKFCKDVSEIEQYICLQNAPFVLKTPYSSSGRGLHWLPERTLTAKDKTWIEGALKKQGTVSIECALEKLQDFAMEFYSDGRGNVTYEGLSVFGAGKKGAYSGNVLGSREYLETFFYEKFGKEQFERIKRAVQEALQPIYGSIYTGYLGVDMLVYYKADKSLGIHPCIEINMRYTMGLVALRISQKYLAPKAIGDMHITYESVSGEAYEYHRLMENAYPLKIQNGKIRAGYLPLCPVTKDTHYRAYILVM